MAGIEAELKTKFNHPVQRAHINILFTASWVRARIIESLRPFDLTPEQFNILRILRGQKGKPIRAKDIGDRMMDRSSNTTRIVDKLVSKKLVVRDKSDEDGREKSIFLTEKGFNLLTSIDEAWREKDPHEACLTHEEAELLSQLLDRVREISSDAPQQSANGTI
jgi:DNA-binding MarR family transcriptional regulator